MRRMSAALSQGMLAARIALIGGLLALPLTAAFGQAAFTTGYRYDAVGRVTGTISPDPDGAGPLRYLAVRNTYDLAGRLIKVEKGQLANWPSVSTMPINWAGFTISDVSETTYDAFDRKVRELRSSATTNLVATHYSYDAAGQLLCTAVRMDPAQWASQTNACVPQTGAAQGPDRISKNLYDAAGQLLQVQKAVGTALQQNYATYSYTLNGKRASLVDANGNRAELGYDGHDRQSHWYFPSSTVPGQINPDDYEAYGYDLNGNRTSLRKRDGQIIGYTYDALNRVTLKDLPGTALD